LPSAGTPKCPDTSHVLRYETVRLCRIGTGFWRRFRLSRRIQEQKRRLSPFEASNKEHPDWTRYLRMQKTNRIGLRQPPWALKALAAILVLAAAMRLWGITFGLPYEGVTYNQVTWEESQEVHRAFKLGAGEYTWSFGKGGLYYLLFVEFGMYFVVSW